MNPSPLLQTDGMGCVASLPEDWTQISRTVDSKIYRDVGKTGGLTRANLGLEHRDESIGCDITRIRVEALQSIEDKRCIDTPGGQLCLIIGTTLHCCT